MAARDAAERRTIARIAAHTRWALEPDRTAATSAARANGPGSLAYWMRRVDPDGTLAKADPHGTQAMAESAKTAHFQALARSGRKAKAAKATPNP